MDPTQYQGGASQKKVFRPEKAEDWEPYREIIAGLYAEMTLTKVMDEMEAVYGFSGTRKQYKTKIRDWGLTNKYIKKDEYESLINQGQKAVYDVRGKRVTHSDVERFKRRQEKISEEKKHTKDYSKRKSHSSTPAGGSSSRHRSSPNHNSSNLSLGYYDDNAGEGSSGRAGGGYSMPTVPVVTTTAGGYVTFPTVGPAGSTGGYVVPGPADYATMGFYGDGSSAGMYNSQQAGGSADMLQYPADFQGSLVSSFLTWSSCAPRTAADPSWLLDVADPTQPGNNPHGHGGWY